MRKNLMTQAKRLPNLILKSLEEISLGAGRKNRRHRLIRWSTEQPKCNLIMVKIENIGSVTSIAALGGKILTCGIAHQLGCSNG